MEKKLNVLEVTADVNKLRDVLDFIDSLLEEAGCPMKVQMQIDLAVEELFVNIANYAYTDGKGKAQISALVTKQNAEITFIDSGIPYDPLAKPDPDITLSADVRPIGGLGIFLSKKLMDEVTYKYEDSKNVLTIKKQYQAV
ncbi:MAG: ATP-binding protein [Ruminococcus sp.]|nr:ATP-binding protein [Ruminococcus sp.]